MALQRRDDEQPGCVFQVVVFVLSLALTVFCVTAFIGIALSSC